MRLVHAYELKENPYTTSLHQFLKKNFPGSSRVHLPPDILSRKSVFPRTESFNLKCAYYYGLAVNSEAYNCEYFSLTLGFILNYICSIRYLLKMQLNLLKTKKRNRTLYQVQSTNNSPLLISINYTTIAFSFIG